MLFWHTALLFSVLCTPAIVTTGAMPAAAPQAVGPEQLQGCWRGTTAKALSGGTSGKASVVGQTIGIVGPNIVMSSMQAVSNPEEFVGTYWIESKTGCSGIRNRNAEVPNRFRIASWDPTAQQYKIRFSAVASDGRAGARHTWTDAPALGLGKKMKSRMGAAHQSAHPPPYQPPSQEPHPRYQAMNAALPYYQGPPTHQYY